MSIEFFQAFRGQRMVEYAPQPPLLDPPDDESEPEGVELAYELAPERWEAQAVRVPAGWHASHWPERPVRFVDGKDVGATIAWLRAPGGYPVPVRLSQIGATTVRVA